VVDAFACTLAVEAQVITHADMSAEMPHSAERAAQNDGSPALTTGGTAGGGEAGGGAAGDGEATKGAEGGGNEGGRGFIEWPGGTLQGPGSLASVQSRSVSGFLEQQFCSPPGRR